MRFLGSPSPRYGFSPDAVKRAKAIAKTAAVHLLIDRPDVADAQRALVELASVRDADAVVVNVGLPARHPLSLPIVEVAAASRVGAEAARGLLLGR